MLLTLASVTAVLGGTPANLAVLKSAREVRELPVAEARRGYPVHLAGVITYADPGSGRKGQLFMQDTTAGIFIFDSASLSSTPHTGQRIEVDGITTAGDFSPCITKASIKLLGTGTLPSPKHPIFDRLLATSEDGQWSELTGVVRSGQIKGSRLFLNVATAGGSFLAVMFDFRSDWQKSLVDSRVTMLGALAPIRNENRQTFGVRIFIPGPSFIRIDEAAPADPFNRPQSSAASVGEFRVNTDPDRRIRVRATVTAVDPGIATYVSDGTADLEVQAFPPCPAGPGDQVDVVGFAGAVDGRPGLQDAVCRKLAPGGGVQPVLIKAGEVLSLQNFTDPSGSGQAAATRYDAKLVRIEGILLQSSRSATGYSLVLESGNRDFLATIPAAPGSAVPSAENGSKLQLTGVCLVTYDQYHRGQSFRILLRATSDIVVMASPRWWSLKYALWSLGLALIAMLAAITWISSLRHQVARHTRELRTANATLQRLSSQDGLTGAANRRQFDQILEAEFKSARRSGSPLSLLLLDIDDFKALNDRHGHQAGDECLVRVATALESVSRRDADLVARYGGEEFAVVLPHTDQAQALSLAEAMRLAVLELAVQGPFAHPRNLSVSVGVATFLCGDSSPAILIAEADRTLYQAKLLGKNCCISGESAVHGALVRA